MSNNTTLNSMTGGDVIQTVDNTTYKTPVTVIASSTGANLASVSTTGELSIRQPDLSASGSLGAANAAVTLTLNGCSGVVFSVSGTYSGTLVYEATGNGGTSWVSIPATIPSTGVVSTNTTGVSTWQANVAGFQQFRIRCSAYTSGSASVAVQASEGTSVVTIGTPLPVGTNSIGTVVLGGGAANIGNVFAAGPVAVGSAASGQPLLIATAAATANPTAVSNGQVQRTMVDKVGRQIVISGHVRDLVTGQATTITSSTSATTVVTAAGASTFADITHIDVTNGSATATTVTLSDGTKSYIYNVAAGGGFVIDFTTPLPGTTANTAWTLTCGTSVASVYCNVVYVKNL